MVLPHEIPPDFRGGAHIFTPTSPSGQSRVYRVTQLRTDGVHCRESAGTEPVILEIIPVTGAAFSGFTTDQLKYASLFPYPLKYWYEVVIA